MIINWNGLCVEFFNNHLTARFDATGLTWTQWLIWYGIINGIFSLITHYHLLYQWRKEENRCPIDDVLIFFVFQLILGLPVCLLWNVFIILKSILIFELPKLRWHPTPNELDFVNPTQNVFM